MSTSTGSDSDFQMAFLPWFHTREPLTIGPVRFSPYPEGQNSYLPCDVGLRRRVGDYFRHYVQVDGKRIESLTVLSVDRSALLTENGSKYEIIRAATDFLAFAAISRDLRQFLIARNGGMPSANSDMFELVVASPPTSDGFIRVNRPGILGAWSIGNVSFVEPFSTIGRFASCEPEPLSALSRYFSDKRHRAEWNRIRLALEWYRLAHTVADGSPSRVKITAIATAFESLYDLSSPDKAGALAYNVEDALAYDEFKYSTRRKEVKGRRSLLGWWAWDFYKLRNKIVHGDRIPPSRLAYRSGHHQLLVGSVVLALCIRRKLFQMNAVDVDRLRRLRQVLPGLDLDRLWRSGHQDVYRALGWLR